MLIKRIFTNLFHAASKMNKKMLISLLDNNPNAKLLDLGCDVGELTKKIADALPTKDVTGVDVVEKSLLQAKKNGIKTVMSNLNDPLPFPEETFDVVMSNQVIEHLCDLDQFVSEIYRILKPGGYAITSTENGSSWHNIFAAILGWQIFSSTNISVKELGIGNPLAYYRGRDDVYKANSWTHKTVLYYKGFKELFKLYGFEDITIVGSGYHPLPPFVGRIDPRHAHFLILKGYKSGKL